MRIWGDGVGGLGLGVGGWGCGVVGLGVGKEVGVGEGLMCSEECMGKDTDREMVGWMDAGFRGAGADERRMMAAAALYLRQLVEAGGLLGFHRGGRALDLVVCGSAGMTNRQTA